MATSSSLLHFFLLLLSSLPILLVKSDQTLITHLCNRTPEPVICSDCLKSDPSSQTADSNGLALILVKCAEKDTNLMYESISKIYEKTPKGSPLEQILEDCTLRTYSTTQEYYGITNDVREKAYDSAKMIISENVIPFVNACIDEYNRHPTMPVPSAVLSGTEAVNQDIKVLVAALNII